MKIALKPCATRHLLLFNLFEGIVELEECNNNFETKIKFGFPLS